MERKLFDLDTLPANRKFGEPRYPLETLSVGEGIEYKNTKSNAMSLCWRYKQGNNKNFVCRDVDGKRWIIRTA